MKVFLSAMAGVAAMVLATGANAAVLTDNFNSENGGNTALNYTGFANFNVPIGSVDLIKSGDFGITCVGGAGMCVDLDGTTNSGGYLETKQTFTFNPGDQVFFSLMVSGNQRSGGGAADDDFSMGFDFNGNTTLQVTHLAGSAAFGAFPPFSNVETPDSSGNIGGVTGPIAYNAPFTTYDLSFTAVTGGSFEAFFGTDSADNIGPIADNFSLSVTPSQVPEPMTLSLFGGGLLALGAMRRKKKAERA